MSDLKIVTSQIELGLSGGRPGFFYLSVHVRPPMALCSQYVHSDSMDRLVIEEQPNRGADDLSLLLFGQWRFAAEDLRPEGKRIDQLSKLPCDQQVVRDLEFARSSGRPYPNCEQLFCRLAVAQQPACQIWRLQKSRENNPRQALSSLE